MDPQWLTWAKVLHAIAQTGLTYAKDPYDVERYESVRLVASQMMAARTVAGSACREVVLASVSQATRLRAKSRVFFGGSIGSVLSLYAMPRLEREAPTGIIPSCRLLWWRESRRSIRLHLEPSNPNRPERFPES